MGDPTHGGPPRNLPESYTQGGRVFVEVIANCGDSVFVRDLNGVIFVCLFDDLISLFFKQINSFIDDESSDDSDYSRDGSDMDEEEWEDHDSGSESTNVTSISCDSPSSQQSRELF
ncbi:hypothetical protein EMWEY_00058740 [Eimeria maxima]|uniref:Uncharacterized protein n=1 Tax=Eimeria maxima TaxID=5804 RepID=U6M6R1_EIMMA|nr:hypothetical protein EMWEY_00058740 [Eimeria maxima]CDJ59706.1 hypothetical protein EMWEY_00058740 [Eimeria maxima]